jgi:hypothetical protein
MKGKQLLGARFVPLFSPPKKQQQFSKAEKAEDRGAQKTNTLQFSEEKERAGCVGVGVISSSKYVLGAD